jgi:hypothetical protein
MQETFKRNSKTNEAGKEWWMGSQIAPKCLSNKDF